MELENKLDEDFLFYLGFMSDAANKLKNAAQYERCQQWFQKLCGEQTLGVDAKRNRNIFLSHLVLCLQEGKLTGVFIKKPPVGHLPLATDIFGPQQSGNKEPAWMADMLAGAGGDGGDDEAPETHAGRTYVATKALPDGRGALGYIAVSLDDGEPRWLQREGLEAHMAQKFQEYNPPISEIERILINRRNPEERQRIVEFYDSHLLNIKQEIEGRIPFGSHPGNNVLVEQLVNNLIQRGTYAPFEQLPENKKRLELLLKLDVQLRERRDRAKNREAFLDDIENEVMAESFWDNSISPEDVYKEDKHAYAIQMWEQAINKGPKMGHMDLLNESYPQILVKKFLELLANAKEEIAVRVQRRHENIVTQLKKELRKAGAKGKKKYDDAKYTCDEIVLVLNAVRAAEKKVIESKERRHQFLYGHNQERDEMYEQMKHAMLETQQHVVEEAERGKFLTEQINELNEQNEEFRHVTDDSIRQIEDVNMDLMKNIQRLCKAIRQHEMRIEAMKKFARKEDALEEGKSSAQFFYF